MLVPLSYWLVSVVLGLFLVYKIIRKKVYKFPPGPKGLPILGNLFEISVLKSHMQYAELAKQYGDVITINMAGMKSVIFNSSGSIRDAFVAEESRNAFAGRPDSFYVKFCDPGPSTAFMDFGDMWKRQREFLVTTLKQFADGNHATENTIKQELDVAVQNIRATEGKPFNIKEIILPALANTLLVLITGQRYDYGDPTLKAAIVFDDADAKILTGHMITILTMFPFLRHFPGHLGDLYRNFKTARDNLFQLVFDKSKETYEPNKTRGFLDTLFTIQSNDQWLKDDNIKGIIRETIGAGLGTTRSTLMSFFLIILHHPEVMRNIQKEIDDVIGSERSPGANDRGQMPYTEAVSMEIFRYVSVTPLGAPHSVTKDVHFRNFFLPKGTLVFANQWAAHHDERVWVDPWCFRPERFLMEDGSLVTAGSTERKLWVPFGVGKRACLGEAFARSRVFLFIATLLQQFDFRPCADDPPPSCDPRQFNIGISIHPPQFRLIALSRRQY